MFLNDDEMDDFYIKSDSCKNNIQSNDADDIHRKPLCQFFIPKAVSKVKFDKLTTNNKSDLIPKDQGNSVDLNHINMDLSLISNPKKNSIISNELLKKENDIPPFSSPSSPSESFSSLPPLHASSVTKSTSDLCIDEDSDQSSRIKHLNTKIEKSVQITDSYKCQTSSDHIFSSPNAITSSSYAIYTSNTSTLKSGPETSNSSCVIITSHEYPVYRSWEALSCDSSLSSIRSLHVDIDKGNDNNSQRSTVVAEQPKADRNLKRKADDEIPVQSDVDRSKRFKCSIESKDDMLEEVIKPVHRAVESDVDSEKVLLENKKSLVTVSSKSVSQNHHIRSTMASIRSMQNNLIFCFVCCVDSVNPCDKHATEKIFNLNIECPFLEYLTDDSFKQYFDNSIDVLCCCCNQNELDHIQQSLPAPFQLRGSESSNLGVWSKLTISPGTIIGPYLGEIVTCSHSKQSSEFRYKTRGSTKSGYSSPGLEFAFKSNWLRYVNFTDDQRMANLKIVHLDGKVFFQVMREIIESQQLWLYNNVLSELPANDLSSLDNISIASSSEALDCTILSEKDIEGMPFQGTKYRKAMIVDIAKIWREQPTMTIADTLKLIRKKHPDARSLTTRYLSKLARKYRLRHKGGANVKFDSQMREFVRITLLKSPRMSLTLLCQKLKDRFPFRMQMDLETLAEVVYDHKLRPNIPGSLNTTATDKRDEKRINNKQQNVWLKESKSVKQSVKNDGQMTDMVAITSLSGKNNEAAIVERIEEILFEEPYTTVDQIARQIKQQFPFDYTLDIETVKVIMRNNNLRTIHKNVRKIDEEMTKVICDLRRQNPRFSALTINHYLRRLLPNKPFVEPNSIYMVLRRFHLTSRSQI